jgi:hypothetical protein
VSRRTARPVLIRALAFLRSRLLGAVTLPALLGAGWAVHRGLSPAGPWPIATPSKFLRLPPWLVFLFALVGLAAVELMNLFGSDYVLYLTRRSDRGNRDRNNWMGRAGRPASELPSRRAVPPPGPVLPGNPVVSPRLLLPERIPRVVLPLVLAGAAALLFFVLSVGPGVLAFLAPAAAVGALYVFSPFPYAFLATALVPPLVSGGVAFVLAGRPQTAAFLAGLPVTWISVGVILTYRVAYAPNRAGERSEESRAPGAVGAARRADLTRRLRVVLAPYAAAVLNIGLLLALGLYPFTALVALVPAVLLPVWAARLLRAERRDPVPATAVGVLLHSSVTLLLALGLFLG